MARAARAHKKSWPPSRLPHVALPGKLLDVENLPGFPFWDLEMAGQLHTRGSPMARLIWAPSFRQVHHAIRGRKSSPGRDWTPVLKTPPQFFYKIYLYMYISCVCIYIYVLYVLYVYVTVYVFVYTYIYSYVPTNHTWYLCNIHIYIYTHVLICPNYPRTARTTLAAHMHIQIPEALESAKRSYPRSPILNKLRLGFAKLFSSVDV